ncbi:BMP family ABC transporter substrate-binding protein [Nostoc sp.]|uniref:BMP family ABC transporter substrate-binding protein n=1 Tax=Nostoc sp. TaxID=1180 RepID=UPI002FF917B9
MTIDFPRRKFILYGSATFATSLLLKACKSNDTTPTVSSNGESFKIAIALPGMITDKAWNQSGYEGLNLAKQKLGAEVAYLEQVAQADQTEALTDFARKGYNVVFAHGGQFDAAIEQVAPQFPNTFFVGVNGNNKRENIASLRIDHLQGSYLCGIIGAALTKSNKLAYIAGQEFDIRATGEDIKVSQLSGGNQQKVVLARELAREPNLIIPMQPTRGLDVGATAAVHSQLLAQRDRGAAILYISTELEEVMAMSDRIAVIFDGEFVAILDAQSATIEQIGLLMAGGTRRG